jgi:hypothetical protein
VKTFVGVEVSVTWGVDTAGVVDSADTTGGAGIGLLGVWLGWPLGVALIGWVAVLMSAGSMLVVFSCSQAMVSPSDAIRVAANSPITSSTRRVRSPRASSTLSTLSTGIGGVPPGAEAPGLGSAVSASIGVADAVS